MDQVLLQLGVGGILCLMILEKVFAFLKSKKDGGSDDIRKILKMTEDLHKWHSVEDSEGVKIWYVRRSLEEAIVDLSKNIATQTTVMQEMFQEMKLMRHDLEEK